MLYWSPCIFAYYAFEELKIVLNDQEIIIRDDDISEFGTQSTNILIQDGDSGTGWSDVIQFSIQTDVVTDKLPKIKIGGVKYALKGFVVNLQK